MLQTSNRTWRTQTVTVKANRITDVYCDGNPNVFWIKNTGESPIYIKLDGQPTEKFHDKLIMGFSDDITGRPVPTNHFWVLNNTSVDTEIVVYSTEYDFDVMILKKNVDTVISGVKEGVNVSVNDNKLSDIMESTITEDDGYKYQRVTHPTLRILYACIDTVLSKLKVHHTMFDNLNECISDSTLSVVTPINNLRMGTVENETELFLSHIKNIHLLTNDSGNDVKITLSNGQNVILKSGETLNDVLNISTDLTINVVNGLNFSCRYVVS